MIEADGQLLHLQAPEVRVTVDLILEVGELGETLASPTTFTGCPLAATSP